MSITNNDGNFITNVAGQSKEDKNTNIQIKDYFFSDEEIREYFQKVLEVTIPDVNMFMM